MPKLPERSPNDKPQILKAPALSIIPVTHNGRPKKLTMPPLPGEVYEAMSDLERQHFDFFVQSAREEYPDLTPFDVIQLNMLALCYINVLRLEVLQLANNELITMSRQDPRTQFMRYMDALAVRRRDRKPVDKPAEDDASLDFLKKLSR